MCFFVCVCVCVCVSQALMEKLWLSSTDSFKEELACVYSNKWEGDENKWTKLALLWVKSVSLSGSHHLQFTLLRNWNRRRKLETIQIRSSACLPSTFPCYNELKEEKVSWNVLQNYPGKEGYVFTQKQVCCVFQQDNTKLGWRMGLGHRMDSTDFWIKG